MNRTTARLASAAVLALAAGAALSLPAQATPTLDLKGEAGRYVGADNSRLAGAGTTAQASWTTDEAYNGSSHSMLLEKSVATSSWSFAQAVVQGAEGMTVGDLGTIGFWVKGACTGGAPRFNLEYDTNEDGVSDGTAFFGCWNNRQTTSGDWTYMEVQPDLVTGELTDDNGAILSPNDVVMSLSVFVDEQGTYYVDDVLAAGQTLGEPSS